MDFDELHNAILAIMPDAYFDEDNEGQIVIYTGLREDARGNIIQFNA